MIPLRVRKRAAPLLLSTWLLASCREPSDPSVLSFGSCEQPATPTLALPVGSSHRVSDDAAECFVLGDRGEYLLTIANTGPGLVADFHGVDSMVLVMVQGPPDAADALAHRQPPTFDPPAALS